MKKSLILLGLVFCVFSLSACGASKSSEKTLVPPAQPTPVPTRPIEQSIKERPFISLVPTADGHWVNLEVKNIINGATGIVYDLTYLAEVEGSKIERGVSTGDKPVELGSAREYAKKILFGSASCTTGVCKYKYDENVNEGMVSLNFTGAVNSEKYQSVYRIQKGKEAKVGLTTGDGIFSFVSSSLPANTLYLTISTIGVPIPLAEGIIAKSPPYGIFPAISAKGTVSFKFDSEAEIYAYNGKTWQKLITTVTNGIASADSSGASIFILAK